MPYTEAPRYDELATPSAQSQTELRQLATDRTTSALGKYRALAVGRPGLWALVKYELMAIFLAPLPGALGYWLRQKLYGTILGHLGQGVVIGRNVTLRHPHRIRIDDHVVIDDNVVLDGKSNHATALHIESGAIVSRNTILCCKGGQLTIGQQANLSVNCTLISETELHVHEKVLIAGHSYLIAGGNHGLRCLDAPILDQPLEQKGGIEIDRHSWLGAGVVVLDGVTVGRDAVVGAGAVVREDVAPYTIVGGVPAKRLRDRRGSTAYV
jgi:acetyltransferase-like isoleucine patch superfamily enzyme